MVARPDPVGEGDGRARVHLVPGVVPGDAADAVHLAARLLHRVARVAVEPGPERGVPAAAVAHPGRLRPAGRDAGERAAGAGRRVTGPVAAGHDGAPAPDGGRLRPPAMRDELAHRPARLHRPARPGRADRACPGRRYLNRRNARRRPRIAAQLPPAFPGAEIRNRRHAAYFTHRGKHTGHFPECRTPRMWCRAPGPIPR